MYKECKIKHICDNVGEKLNFFIESQIKCTSYQFNAHAEAMQIEKL
jgi:hypothetical protein